MKRVQRKRTKGYKLPTNTVSVCRPTKWGNPMMIEGDTIFIDAGYRRKILGKWVILKENANIDDMLNLYEKIVRGDKFNNLDLQYWSNKFKIYDLNELKGKNLACFCPLNKKCHADILIKIIDKK